ncbi:MAG: hypothetical protein DWQ07_06510 [Chloroflexi bacterium]|nr:MAG: hypothetical protein DWQ07_06510 [Chloroflexota bacterium]MBL1195918.1 hypothetical protein [Chloroflexota bacterium]NOH13211.1 hypothetical protein [Chloroflexota bacterium]
MKSNNRAVMPFFGLGIVFFIIGLGQSSTAFFVLGISFLVLSFGFRSREREACESDDDEV